jgi:hypothetical protein
VAQKAKMFLISEPWISNWHPFMPQYSPFSKKRLKSLYPILHATLHSSSNWKVFARRQEE